MESEKKRPRRITGAPRKKAAPSAPKSAASKSAASGAGLASRKGIPPEERHQLIARAAYLRAESRGFEGGSPEQDWLDAEAEIDATLLRVRRRDE